ncbi:hypothetical protein K501DRAFT_271569 [Backusella circina FSU 941]|nr:hypothetical protein K501DRAFT_271569 [Backusella circina FSU 941]
MYSTLNVPFVYVYNILGWITAFCKLVVKASFYQEEYIKANGPCKIAGLFQKKTLLALNQIAANVPSVVTLFLIVQHLCNTVTSEYLGSPDFFVISSVSLAFISAELSVYYKFIELNSLYIIDRFSFTEMIFRLKMFKEATKYPIDCYENPLMQMTSKL